MRKLDLRLFDDGAAAGTAAEALEGTPGEPTEGAGAGSEEVETEEQKRARFDEAIKGEFREYYDQEMQKAIKRRVSEEKNLQKTIEEQSSIIELVAKKYGISTDKYGEIRGALESDEGFWEEAAAEHGMSVDSYKKMTKLEAENEKFRRAAQEAERKNQNNAIMREWDHQAEELKTLYPNFDISTEIQNDRFSRLLGAGIDMKTAFETIHNEEIMQGLMKQNAKHVAKQQADAIRAGQLRPRENGNSQKAQSGLIKDASKMTREERQALAKRAARGEIITLRE